MEMFLEFIFDVVVEGCLNLISNKKIPFLLRVLMGMVLGIVFGGIFLLLVALMFLSLRSHDYLISFILLFVVLDSNIELWVWEINAILWKLGVNLLLDEELNIPIVAILNPYAE